MEKIGKHAHTKKQTQKNIGIAIGIFLGICKIFVEHGPFHIYLPALTPNRKTCTTQKHAHKKT